MKACCLVYCIAVDASRTALRLKIIDYSYVVILCAALNNFVLGTLWTTAIHCDVNLRICPCFVPSFTILYSIYSLCAPGGCISGCSQSMNHSWDRPHVCCDNTVFRDPHKH
jgi:hypothetical protein